MLHCNPARLARVGLARHEDVPRLKAGWRIKAIIKRRNLVVSAVE